MITKLITFVSSLVAGASLLFGGAAVSSFPVSQSGDPGAGSQTQIAPHGDRAFQAAQVIKLDSTPRERFTSRLSMLDRRIGQRGLGLGDEIVRYGLVLATVSATGLSPVDVLTGIDSGSSIADLAEADGSSADAVLTVYDDTVAYFFNRAVENGRLPEAFAQSRIDWYQEAARQMIDQPGLEPPYPGLHELHKAIIMAAIQVGDLDRKQVRDGLQTCQSLEEILEANGHTEQEAVDYAAERIGNLIDRGVEAGKLTDTQAAGWLASIIADLEEMVKTPGLHIAGQQCSN